MANEAVILELLGYDKGQDVRYTCANATGIAKGCILQVSGADLTVIASAGSGDTFAGIASAEKVASDGATSIGAHTEGIFDLTCIPNGAEITLGSSVAISGANLIRKAKAADLLCGGVVGVAMEAGGASTVIRVHVGKP